MMIYRLFSRKRITGPEKKICNIVEDPVDHRDRNYMVSAAAGDTLPPRVLLSAGLPEVKQQGSIGSCGSHVLCSAAEASAHYTDRFIMPLSERWHYWRVRQRDYMNTYPQDTGQHFRHALKVAHKIGIAPEVLCPYDVNKYNEDPGTFAHSFAKFFKIKSYHRCYSVDAIRKALAQGMYVELGIHVYRSFLRNDDGMIVLPTAGDRKAGGHAILLYGHDDNNRMFDFINSWGKQWGRNGYGDIPYEYVKKYLISAWAMRY